jgi:hypothetical protein
MIIGISGKIGSGKDAVGKLIQHLICESKGLYIQEYQILKEGNNPDNLERATLLEYLNNVPQSLQQQSGWEIKRFAGKLKEIVALLTGCNVLDLESQEFKNRELDKNWWTYKHLDTGTGARPKFEYTERSCNNLSPEELAGLGDRITKPTYRSLLQAIGTDSVRNIIGDNTWINALFADYKGVFRGGGGLSDDDLTQDYPNWIIPDTRFPNEADAIKQNGGILIRVNRNWRFEHGLKVVHNLIPTSEQHPSETSLDNYEFHHVIDNDGTIEELVEKVRKILLQENIIQ